MLLATGNLQSDVEDFVLLFLNWSSLRGAMLMHGAQVVIFRNAAHVDVSRATAVVLRQDRAQYSRFRVLPL